MATGNPLRWDATDESLNGSIDPAVTVPEGMLPGAVNNGIRQVMTGVAALLQDGNGTLSTGGTANALTVTSNIPYVALASGISFVAKASATNTAAAALTFTPQGASAFASKAIKVLTATGGESDVAPGQIRANGHYRYEYDAAANAAAGAWILTNPSRPHIVDAGLAYALPMINGQIVVSVAGNAATFAIKNLAGNDPSASDPVLVLVRNATASSDQWTVMTLTAATSITVSSGSTLGTGNNVPFRVWVVGFNDAGTFRLGVINCTVGASSPTQVTTVPEWNAQLSSTAEGGAGAADSAGVIYTGTAVTNKPLRLLGFAEWPSGLTTAGTWASTPSFVQQMGRGIPRPGDIVQTVYGTFSAASSTSTTAGNTGGVSITPKSAANPIAVHCDYMGGADVSGVSVNPQVARNTTTLIGQTGQFITTTGGTLRAGQGHTILDAPGVVSSTGYSVRFASGTAGQNVVIGPGTFLLQELMG